MTTSATQAIEPDQLVLISHVMPAEVAVQFQLGASGLLQRLLQGRQPAAEIDLSTWDSSTFEAPNNINFGPVDAWTMDVITFADVRAACWAVDNWTDTGRSLAAGLLTHPDGIRTYDLARLIGYQGGISSAMRHVAGRLRAIGRAPFWHGDPSSKNHPDGQRLWIDVDGEPYRVMKKVFEARYSELLEQYSTGGAE